MEIFGWKRSGEKKDTLRNIEFFKDFVVNIVDETMAQAIRDVCNETNLVVNEGQIKKALEFYEQTRQRMGVVLVGPSGSGKSTLWRILRAAMMRLGKQVKQYVMNPKALPRQQLLGSIDMDTREWSDGVLTFAARQVVKEPVGKLHIILASAISKYWLKYKYQKTPM